MTVPPALTGTLAVIRLLPRVSRPMTLALYAMVAVQSALPIAFMIVSGRLVGTIPTAIRYGLDSGPGRTALTFLVATAAIIAVQNIVAPVMVALSEVFGRAVDRYLQEQVMAAVARPSEIAHLEETEVLDLISTSQGIGSRGFMRPGMAVSSLARLIPSWTRSLGGAVVLIFFQWWLGFAWLLVWPVLLYYLSREYIKVSETGAGQSAALRRADYYCDLALAPPGAKELRIWALSDWLISRFQRSWLLAMGPIWKARRPGRGLIWGTLLVAGLGSALTFGLIARAAAQGEIGLAALAVFLQAALAVSEFQAFDDANMNLAYAGAAVPSLLRLDRRLKRGVRPEGAVLPADAPVGEIRFDCVGMRYPGQKGDALSDINLSIRSGRSIAIVGANGAGKTTLVKLLCGLYHPSTGRVTVDGTDLTTIRPDSWQRRVAAIYQDFARLHLSARDNIGMGSIEFVNGPDREGADRALRAAAERAGVLDVIGSLPHGWDTVLSREYEGGSDLSGGQWQRVALARALFAVEGGARILVLDEPTANLDVRAEAELYDRFLEITAGLTTILISHRFSTVRRADYIVVLDGGTIVERGTHDELVALGGRYAEMFRLQADRFVEEGVH
jgi:ATP-binding cassette, subfamily B, bacterial